MYKPFQDTGRLTFNWAGSKSSQPQDIAHYTFTRKIAALRKRAQTNSINYCHGCEYGIPHHGWLPSEDNSTNLVGNGMRVGTILQAELAVINITILAYSHVTNMCKRLKQISLRTTYLTLSLTTGVRYYYMPYILGYSNNI